MAGEDQERFEDYLELEQYIEKLQAGHVAHPPSELTPAQASIYRMAALFRSANPEESEPRPEFVAQLQTRLEQEIQQPSKPGPFSFLAKKHARDTQRKRVQVSRRALLAGGAAAAASLVAGTAIGTEIAKSNNNSSSGSGQEWSTQLIGEAGAWLRVAPLAALGDNAIRFTTETVVGYIIRNDHDDGETSPDPVIAISAACTHMGCIVQWQDSDRKYHCPCHGGLFSEYGKADSASPIAYNQLPRLETRIIKNQNGVDTVEVKVPVSASQANKSATSPESKSAAWLK